MQKKQRVPIKTLIIQFLEKYPITWYIDERLYSHVKSHWGKRPSKVAIRQALADMRDAGNINARAFYNPNTKKACSVFTLDRTILHSRNIFIYLLDAWAPKASIYQQIALVHKWGGAYHIAKVWQLENKRLTIPEALL